MSKKLNLKKQIEKNPFLLAPMDNVTDICFRELCEKYGASYTCTELTSVESMIRGFVPDYRIAKGNLNINCVQIFGSKPGSFAKATNMLNERGDVDIIDINFGCPSPNVVKNNSGSSLLKDPKNVGEIVSAVVKNSDVPVTAKIRLGYKDSTYLKIAKEIEDAGAELITVHGRTAKQKYSGLANWDAIKEVYDNSNILVIGNGDVKDENDVEKYLLDKENKYAEGLMVGRASIGNPYLFEKLNHYYKTGKRIEFETPEIKKSIQKQAFIEYLEKAENVDFYKKDFKIRQQAMWFTKGIEGSKELRCNISNLKDTKEIIRVFKEF